VPPRLDLQSIANGPFRRRAAEESGGIVDDSLVSVTPMTSVSERILHFAKEDYFDLNVSGIDQDRG
jgi:hypothetical protein